MGRALDPSAGARRPELEASGRGAGGGFSATVGGLRAAGALVVPVPAFGGAGARAGPRHHSSASRAKVAAPRRINLMRGYTGSGGWSERLPLLRGSVPSGRAEHARRSGGGGGAGEETERWVHGDGRGWFLGNGVPLPVPRTDAQRKVGPVGCSRLLRHRPRAGGPQVKRGRIGEQGTELLGGGARFSAASSGEAKNGGDDCSAGRRGTRRLSGFAGRLRGPPFGK